MRKMSHLQIVGLAAFGMWFLPAALLQEFRMGALHRGDFLQMAILCGLNLLSLGKLFANLAGAVSSVDPIQKRLLGSRAIYWGCIKGASLLTVVILLWKRPVETAFSSLLGLSGWIAVPLVFGAFSRIWRETETSG
jgi:hypothetical protein